MTEPIDKRLQAHLLKFIHEGRRQEELTFALWRPSKGLSRQTAMIFEILLPEDGERVLSGNAAFTAAYVNRVVDAATAAGAGVALLHSHFTPGWQDMSRDDFLAESRLAPFVSATTGLPLVGLTLGTDGTWSARWWPQDPSGIPQRIWCELVRVVGIGLNLSFHPLLKPPIKTRNEIRYAPAMWGDTPHANLLRARIGIVGLGSVGRAVAEGLARMGVQNVVFIDMDTLKDHNLDRQLGAAAADRGKFKIDLAREGFLYAATSASPQVDPILAWIQDEGALRAALDCDVIFSCVDRSLPRHVLNCLSYAHLIPIIDGGILARFRNGRLLGCEWSCRTSGPGRPCLKCSAGYRDVDVDTERKGLLDDPTYLAGLPRDHSARRNENVFPLSMALAAEELIHLISLIAQPLGNAHLEERRWHLVLGEMVVNAKACDRDCLFPSLTASGDSILPIHHYGK